MIESGIVQSKSGVILFIIVYFRILQGSQDQRVRPDQGKYQNRLSIHDIC